MKVRDGRSGMNVTDDVGSIQRGESSIRWSNPSPLGFPYCLGQFENSNFADFWFKSCDDRMIFVEELALN